MSEFIRVAKTTISQYLKDEEVNVLKNQKLTAMLMSKKRISYGHSGKSLVWPVKKARNGLLPYSDAGVLSFNRVNRWELAELPWRGYAIPEAVTKKEKLMNRGKEALVNYATNLGESIKDDLKFYFAGELYIDGLAAANADRIHGLNSALGITSNAQYTAPSATYAGLSTVLGNYGGAAVSGTWPTGVFDPLYYFWSPLVLNYTHASWSATTDNWANNCLEVLRAGKLYQQNLKGTSGKLDIVVMEASMYGSVLDAYAPKERVMVRRGEDSNLVSLGFTDVVNFDGVDLTADADCPATQAFGLNFDAIELCSMQDQLFDLDDMEDINTMSDKMVGCFFGNLKLNPRHIVLWDDIT